MRAGAEHPKALLIAVHYQATAGMLELLASLRALAGFCQVQVIIADNFSGEERVQPIRRAISDLCSVELLELSANLGYFGAARMAYHHFLASGQSLPEWIIVCNHDVVIEDRKFFTKLFLSNSASAGVIAPVITIPSQHVQQNPFMDARPGGWRRFTMRFYSSAYPLAVAWDWLSRSKRAAKLRVPVWLSASAGSGSRRNIYAAHGAFLIFGRRFFSSGGDLDQQLFLFGEEIAIGETCRHLGLPVIFDPNLRVVHNEHQSVGPTLTRQMYQYHRRAVRHVLEKYLAS